MTSPTLADQPQIDQRPADQSVSHSASRPLSHLRRLGVPLALFVVTMFTTTAVGMRYMYDFRQGSAPLSSDADVLPYGWVFRNLHLFASGLPFSLTLVGILLTHEFGHYFACRHFGVPCTLPFMLPAPSLSGTFGAVIRLKGRITSRAALIAIGASGPVAGFAVALFTVTLGLALSSYADVPLVHNVRPPLLILALHALPGIDRAPLPLLIPHPVLIASWMGLLITALNLIPAGQLDGGHILYALSPEAHRWSSRIVIVTLIVFGFIFWGGWLLWGIILMLPAMRHPRVADSPPPGKGIAALIPLCAVILLLCGTVQPFQGFGLYEILHKFLTHTL